jgi:uncharacterized glyoxalase superfamily protein PhnB
MRTLLLLVLLSACGAPGLRPYADCRSVTPPPVDTADPRTLPLAIELLVPDVDTGVAYYRDALGFAVLRNDADEKSCFAVMRLDDDDVLLSHVNRAWTPLNNQVEVRFIVPDVEATYARMQSGGAEFIRELATADYGLREFVVRDPYGVRLRFATPVP